MDDLWLKILLMGVLFILTVTFSLTPALALRRKYDESTCKQVLSLCNCLASGVFMSMCFLDLLPCVKDKVDVILADLTVATNFPIAESIIVLGFFLVLTIEQATSGAAAAAAKRSTNNGTKNNHHQKLEQERTQPGDDQDLRSPLLMADSEEIELYNAQEAPSIGNVGTGGEAPIKAANGHHGHSHGGHGGHSHDRVFQIVGQRPGLKALVLLLALGVHGVFEGIALGLQTDFQKLLHMFIAISLHECVCAAALGLSVAKMRPTVCTAIRYTSLLSVSIPVGIAIGVAVGQSHGLTAYFVSAILQGMAAGIFLHITFMQMIPGELAEHSNGLVKVLFLFIGFTFMVSVKLLTKG